MGNAAKFIDVSNVLYTGSDSSYTATENCWCRINVNFAAGGYPYCKLDNVELMSGYSSSGAVFTYSSYLKKGQTLSGGNGTGYHIIAYGLL